MSYESFAYVYDRLMDEMPYADWIEFAQACWVKYGTPSTVVDLGCGTGSVTIPLAKLGYKMTGIDLSEDMLAVAQQKEAKRESGEGGDGGSSAGGGRMLLSRHHEPIQWMHQDMREWQLAGQSDAVISFCDCFNYLLEEEDIIRTFKQTYDGLKQGGTFLFDVHHPNQLRRYFDSQPFMLNLDDIAYIWTCDYNESRMQIEHDLTIFSADPELPHMFRRIDETHLQRAYDLDWLKSRLVDAGFSNVTYCADFTFNEPTEESERIFFIAQK